MHLMRVKAKLSRSKAQDEPAFEDLYKSNKLISAHKLYADYIKNTNLKNGIMSNLVH